MREQNAKKDMCEYLKQEKHPVHMAFTNRVKPQVHVIKHIKSDRKAKPNVAARNQPRAVVEAAMQLLAVGKAKSINAVRQVEHTLSCNRWSFRSACSYARASVPQYCWPIHIYIYMCAYMICNLRTQETQ